MAKRKIDDAFQAVPRRNFMPAEAKPLADVDHAAGIGFGQTISQPTTVRHMLGWLDVQAGQKILDVGSGSGWTTALLAYLAGPEGSVQAVELVPELVEFGRANFASTGFDNAEFHQAGKKLGWPEAAPYERILVSASAHELPAELVDQLQPGGKLVIPVGHDILEVIKSEDGSIERRVHPGYVFVPLLPG